MDTFSKSDPFLIMYQKNGTSWVKIGKTEVIHDNLNPSWVTAIPVIYNFEKNDEFKAEVFDIDDDANMQDLTAHDHLGCLEFTLHEIVTCRD
jgi:Ca2+-dependent lipid-binding protein